MSIETPCIQVCEIDAATQLCRGCARSLQEIAQWGRLTEAARSAIMRELPSRAVPDRVFSKERR